ncbi:ABC transporter substrate-binding protein [Streptomyces indicus]|uniref:ABC transporter substrate-binding protein n=1 Tax=Streptomyces indicus TaxID=417292 RepID=UPI001FE62EA3|nr:ABC transporter substrate-binding protein [Streptomyces indicus]
MLDRVRRAGARARHRVRAGAVRLDPRRSLPALWRWSCGEPSRTGQQPLTSELLRRRRLVLPALALLAFALLAAAYFDVHGRTDHVRGRLAPAVTDLATARVQLERAQKEAVRRFGEPRPDGKAGTHDPPQVDIGERYERFLSDSVQALNGATRSTAFDAAQAQELGVVNGLVGSYRSAVSMASENREDRALRKAGLSYGADILCERPDAALRCTGPADPDNTSAEETERPPTSVLGRIAALERELSQEAERGPRAPAPVLLAVLALLATALFGTVLAGTLRFCRRRLRLISTPLWALAMVAAAVCGLLAAGAVEEHLAQRAVRADLTALTERPTTAPPPTGRTDQADQDAEAALARIERTAAEVTARFDEAGPVGWAQTARIAVGFGVAAALAAGLALYGYGREYPSARAAVLPSGPGGRRAGARRRGRRALVVRTLLGAALFTVAALSVYACTGDEPRKVTVLGPWTDGEEDPFLAALDATGIDYAYTGTRSLRDTLLAQLQAGSPPDVAILNSLGELSEYARDGSVLPLPEGLDDAAVGPWAPEVTAADGDGGPVASRAYWVPVRVDLKSIVWRDPDDDSERRRWCLGLSSGATSGWPGTDWVEDLLLRREGPAVYEAWATGDLAWTSPEVRGAWQEWGELLPGGAAADAALVRSFEPRGGLLDARPQCELEHQGSFIRRHYDPSYVPAPTTDFLPRLGKEHADSFEVSGDMAAVFEDRPEAWELLRRLTSAEARTEWAAAASTGARPFFPGAVGLAPEPGSATQKVQQLINGAGQICFDASDAMPPTLRNAFQRAALAFVGAGNRGSALGPLLERLERERQLQEEDKAFRFDDLCEAPPVP